MRRYRVRVLCKNREFTLLTSDTFADCGIWVTISCIHCTRFDGVELSFGVFAPEGGDADFIVPEELGCTWLGRWEPIIAAFDSGSRLFWAAKILLRVTEEILASRFNSTSVMANRSSRCVDKLSSRSRKEGNKVRIDDQPANRRAAYQSLDSVRFLCNYKEQ